MCVQCVCLFVLPLVNVGAGSELVRRSERDCTWYQIPSVSAITKVSADGESKENYGLIVTVCVLKRVGVRSVRKRRAYLL
jgi:hypothetical protein